jgi:radical SAM superfamily enzyme YgiQ (UPF0313 family)
VLNQSLKDQIVKCVLPRVQTPAQYVGGELNAVLKDHRAVRGKLCLAFPDTYTIGMSHHGLQVLYHAMNRRDDWACERVFAPWPDFEAELRRLRLPLYSLETFTPLVEFDVVGFTLQYDLGYANVLTILDLGGIPRRAVDRTLEHPLVIAGGPCAHNPEPMARFIDLFVVGDGEEALPAVCDAWLRLKRAAVPGPACSADPEGRAPSAAAQAARFVPDGSSLRREWLTALARKFPFVYVPRCYEPVERDGRPAGVRPLFDGVPEVVQPAVVDDLDAVPLPTAPIVPNVACVQDRIAIEIMRGCPWRCRFCQSTTIKRPLRFREVETIVRAAIDSYRNTGYEEISLLALSTSDYPQFDELMRRMQETFRPLNVAVSVPSLRINEQWRTLADLLNTDRHSGLTLAPEVALDDMRQQIGKPIKNDDLFAGCRKAFENGFHRVKLYFMCGLPGERPEDLDGMIDMAETIARMGKEVRGRPVTVVVNVSNFVPKPHTPYQWNAMQTREYLRAAHQRLRARRTWRSIEVKCHDVEMSLLEGVLARGDRRVGEAIERAWEAGARLDSWTEHARPARWWNALAEAGIDVEAILHQPYALDARLPWDHIGIRQGRAYLEKEQSRSAAQRAAMPGARPPGS